MTRDEVLTNARHAGSVLRYHTWPVLHRQTIGEHCWQVMRIYWQIWGHLPNPVSTYFLWHDVGELVLGDLPFPIKKDNPKLKEECDRIERTAVKRMGGESSNSTTCVLTDKELLRIKFCDVLDMYEYGIQEMNLGSRYAAPIVEDTHKTLQDIWLKLSIEDHNLIQKYTKVRFA